MWQPGDYVGLVSGNKEPDKFAKAGFHATKSEFGDVPLSGCFRPARTITNTNEVCRSNNSNFFANFVGDSLGDSLFYVISPQFQFLSI